MKKKILNSYINKISKMNIPPQRSEEWYNLRKTTIGGSEIATVIGKNIYKNRQQLLAKKLGILDSNNIISNINNKWGIILEPVTTKFVEQFISVDNKVIEFGSIPGPIKYQRYSPDGLIIVKDYKNNEHIVLLEIKSPISRKVKTLVPNYYLPQIKSGLCTIDPCEYGLFVDINYKLCNYENFNKNNLYSYPKNRLIPNNNPISYGAFKIYKSNNKLEDNDQIFINNIFKENISIDITKLSDNDIERIFNLIYDGNLLSKYSLIYLDNLDLICYNKKNNIINISNNVNIKQVINYINKYDGELGFICWKMFNCSILRVKKDINYLKKNEDKILGFLNELHYFSSLNQEKKKEEFLKKYKYSYQNVNDIANKSSNILKDLVSL